MMIQLLHYTPLWVWALLAALVALGFWQSRPRSLKPAQAFILPVLLLGIGLVSNAGTFIAMPLALLAWAKGLLLSTALTRRIAPAAGTRWDGTLLHLPASWVPMMLIVGIFLLRYASTVALVLHPEWHGQRAVMLPLTALYGAISGLMWGRAFALLALARPAEATMPGDASPRTA